MTPETKVVNYFRRRAREAGFIARKIEYVGRSGCPDQLLITPHAVMLVELKADDGELSRIQEAELNRINKLHYGAAVVATGERGVDALFDHIRETYGRKG